MFFNSTLNSIDHSGLWDTLTSDYMMMDLFIGIFTTIEYYFKELVSLPLRLVFSDSEQNYRGMIAYDPKNELENLHDNIEIIFSDNKTHLISAKVPRHRDLRDLLIRIAQTSIEIKEISGHSKMIFKVRSELDKPLPPSGPYTVHFSYTIPTQLKFKYSYIMVDLPNLRHVIGFLEAHGVEILHAHDF